MESEIDLDLESRHQLKLFDPPSFRLSHGEALDFDRAVSAISLVDSDVKHQTGR